MSQNYQTVLDFWFQDGMEKKWYQKNEVFDLTLRNEFLSYYDASIQNKNVHWEKEPHGVLALIIIFDQFSRNMFRGSAKMYATDAQALRLTNLSLKQGMGSSLTIPEKGFLYMPLMHSEDIDDQDRSVDLFYQLHGENNIWAEQHRDIIQQFGRFPHRNAILDRESTADEIEFLKKPNSSF